MENRKALRKDDEMNAWELYDLSKDISETTEVATQHPDVLAQLKKFAAEARTSTR